MTATPRISIVVVSWNTRELTLRCLASVADDARASAASTETIVVDNDSSDGTVDAIREAWPSVEIVEPGRNVGFAAAANLGIARSAGEFVVLLNPDAMVAMGTLDAIGDFLAGEARAGAAGCRLVDEDGRDQFSCGRFLTVANQFVETLGVRLGPFRRSYAASELDADVVAVDWVVGACVGLRRSAVREVGGFDERFFMYSEDEDLCFRLRTAGWTVHLLGRVRVRHVGGAAAAQALEPMRRAARSSQIAFVRKHRGGVQAMVFRVLMRLASLKPRRDEGRVGWGR